MDIDTVNAIIRNIELSSTGPVQGSEEWHNIRGVDTDRKRGRIGGSEIAALIGENPYKNAKALMEVKLGHRKDKMADRLHCWFGLLFEEVAVKLFEQRYKTTIMCKNISLIDSKLPYSIFSPDGLCAIPLCSITGKVLMNFIDVNHDAKRDYVPVLIEIKCPLSRDLTRNANVPAYYVPQLQKGMYCIDEVHASIFIDNCFRLCAYEDLHVPHAYNATLHRLDRAIDADREEINYGCILFYGSLPNGVDTRYIKRVKISNGAVETYNDVDGSESFDSDSDADADANDTNCTYTYDFGASSYTTVLNLLKELRSNIYTVEYMDPDDIDIHPDPDKSLIGIMCWKLFESTYTLVHKDETMINRIVKSMEKYADGGYDGLVETAVRPRAKKSKPPKKVDSDTDSFSFSE